MVIKEKGGTIFTDKESILTTLAKSELLERLISPEVKLIKKPKYSLEELKLYPRFVRFVEAYKINSRPLPTLLIIGETRFGKSQLVYSFLYRYNLPTLVTKLVDGLKRFTQRHCAIFFDKLNVKNLKEELLTLVET